MKLKTLDFISLILAIVALLVNIYARDISAAIGWFVAVMWIFRTISTYNYDT